MPRKAPLHPGVKAPIQKHSSSTAAAAKTSSASPQQTKAKAYDFKCQRAAKTLEEKYKVQPARADVVRGALQAAYAQLVRDRHEPEAKLQLFMSKAKSNPEYLQQVTDATSAEQVEGLVHRAMFDRFAYAAPQTQARYDHQAAVALDDCKVTPECHAVVAEGTLTPMAFQVGKGMGNEHKNKNLEDHRKSCT